MVPAKLLVPRGHFLIPALEQDAPARLASDEFGVTARQAKQDRLRPSSASRQSDGRSEGQKKNVSWWDHVSVGRIEGLARLAGVHGCCCCWQMGRAVA